MLILNHYQYLQLTLNHNNTILSDYHSSVLDVSRSNEIRLFFRLFKMKRFFRKKQMNLKTRGYCVTRQNCYCAIQEAGVRGRKDAASGKVSSAYKKEVKLRGEQIRGRKVRIKAAKKLKRKNHQSLLLDTRIFSSLNNLHLRTPY